MNLDHVSISAQVTGVILAGGQARRMGGIDKGLVQLAGSPMCRIVIDLLSPQVSEVLINANRNLESYGRFGVPVIEDDIQGFLGPLAGLVSAMKVAKTPWVITVPCDGPFLNRDYVDRMMAQADSSIDIVVAKDAERLQPTFMLAKTDLYSDLLSFLNAGERKIDKWFVNHQYATADFSDSPDCFLNINTSEDCERAESLMAKKSKERLPIIGFAAYSGTGKTTLVSKVIPILRERGLRIGVIKHAHHSFVIDRPGKDSYELRKAGAQQVLIASKQRVAWVMEKEDDSEPVLREMLAQFSDQNLDLVIVEGFKHEPFTKIEVYRSSLKHALLATNDAHVIAVATDRPELIDLDVVALNLSDYEAISQFIIDRMQSGSLTTLPVT